MAEQSLKDPKIMYSALATCVPCPSPLPHYNKFQALTSPVLTSMPLRKVATPQDVANQVAILSSGKLSGHITGQVLMIEGGMEGDDFPWIEELALYAKRLSVSSYSSSSGGVGSLLFVDCRDDSDGGL
jgi:Enoyl-(Acyl carrier protein) reductase